MIMVRTLRRDIARYNSDDGIEEALEESGWKLVHGDVFRPPKYPRLFSSVIGSGIQIFIMSVITICMSFCCLYNINYIHPPAHNRACRPKRAVHVLFLNHGKQPPKLHGYIKFLCSVTVYVAL